MHPDDWPEWKNGLQYPDWKWQEDLDNARAQRVSDYYYYREHESQIQEYYDEQYRWFLLAEIIALLEIRMEDLSGY